MTSRVRDEAVSAALTRLQESPQSIGLLADDTCAQRTLVELVVDAALESVAAELGTVRSLVERRTTFDDGMRAGLEAARDVVTSSQ